MRPVSPLLLARVDKDLDFDFVDVPRHKFYDTGDVKDIRAAHKWLEKKLGDAGPYDGVLAYSQSVALVSSFLLYRQWYEQERPPAFKFAIWLSGGVPLAALRDLGAPVPAAALDAVARARAQHEGGLGPWPAHAARARRAVVDSDDCFGLDLNRVPLELKIRIPTLHAWGRADPLLPSAVHLVGLCDSYIKKTLVHRGARETLPGDPDELEEMAELVGWCVRCASWPGQTLL
ncbi:hypothetical protein GGR52DRAFT_591861 [Hypoxylon sp. FL1284]|nr:hypothetical protein GGR52DRAFT_591861 [Hypoxylon sp. FL1284]